MKVSVKQKDNTLSIFDHVVELSKYKGYVRVRVGAMSRYFDYETIEEILVDGKDVSL